MSRIRCSPRSTRRSSRRLWLAERPAPDGVPAVDVTRGNRIESTHAIAACACDADGTVVLAHGAIDVPLFLRSAAKPFIAAAVVRSGAAERFRFDRREIALIAASHNGEPLHLETARSILAKIGATERDLACGVQTPGTTQLQNNCSGKHAGILALARMLDAPLAGYLDATHPAQRAILGFCERIFDDRFDEDRLGIDGCGIPNFAVSLATAARTFARLGVLDRFEDPRDRDALERVRAAMLGRPWFIGGTGRFDTDLMEAAPGVLLAKSGAEGVHATALLGPGLGLVVKVVDGSRRAVAPATIALLRRLGALAGVDTLAAHEHPPVRNVAGRVVGEISARPSL